METKSVEAPELPESTNWDESEPQYAELVPSGIEMVHAYKEEMLRRLRSSIRARPTPSLRNSVAINHAGMGGRKRR